jgi:hypothetical protein
MDNQSTETMVSDFTNAAQLEAADAALQEQQEVFHPDDNLPTEEQIKKEMQCEHCHSKLVSKAELTGAVQHIHLGLPQFRALMDRVTGVQAKRVLEAIIESPLENEVKRFTTREAMQLFELGISINSAKYVLFQGSKNHYDELADDIEKQMETSDESVAESVDTNNNVTQEEGNTNG